MQETRVFKAINIKEHATVYNWKCVETVSKSLHRIIILRHTLAKNKQSWKGFAVRYLINYGNL